jgi:hypothetical protein
MIQKCMQDGAGIEAEWPSRYAGRGASAGRGANLDDFWDYLDFSRRLDALDGGQDSFLRGRAA